MPRTSVRLPDELEAAAREKCKRLDVSLSYVVRRLLREWVNEVEDETPSQTVADEGQNYIHH